MSRLELPPSTTLRRLVQLERSRVRAVRLQCTRILCSQTTAEGTTRLLEAGRSKDTPYASWKSSISQPALVWVTSISAPAFLTLVMRSVEQVQLKACEIHICAHISGGCICSPAVETRYLQSLIPQSSFSCFFCFYEREYIICAGIGSGEALPDKLRLLVSFHALLIKFK